jgi:hypothetical protein
MRTEMKLDAVKELAGRMMDRVSELQNRMDAALQDNSSKSNCPAQVQRILNECFQGVANVMTGTRTLVEFSPSFSRAFSFIAHAELLNTLEPIRSAAWNAEDVVTCTPSTRELILNDAIGWAEDSGGSCVFWMNGLAGTGKSTIASTVCLQLAERGLLGASFFVKRQDQARRGASNLVRTIAHQLALCQPSFGDALCAQLRKKPMSVSRLLETQIADFVIGPAAAQTESDHTPLVIVIDALDECIVDTRGRPAGDFVLILVRGLLTLSGRFKLFLTSRAEPAIQRMFDQLSVNGEHTVMKLHELEKTGVQADIMTYLRYSFDQMRVDMPRLNLSHWPSTNDLEQLVKLSGVLFVYASTVARYVGSRRHSPRERLAQVLGQQCIGPVTAPYRSLDRLYTQVLEEAVGIRTRSLDESQSERDDVDALCQQVKAVLIVVVLAQIPLQLDAVVTLSGIGHDSAHLAMECLSALVLVEDGGLVRVFHPSFPEFMLDADRCDEPRLHLAPVVSHCSLAFQCLRLMNESLRYNICELLDPDVSNEEVIDLEIRLSANVPDALRYACHFWMVHVIESGAPNSQLQAEFTIFCRKHLFHWLEVLSLLRSWSSTDYNALKVIDWCKVRQLVHFCSCGAK